MSFRVVGVGETLWDLLPSGPQLGGAPGNFAYHARQLGAQAQVITRIGDDAAGRKMFERLDNMGIADGTVQVDGRLPTGSAAVILETAGVPRFAIGADAAWDGLEVTNEALNAVRKANAVCFGSLAQRSTSAAASVRSLVASTPLAALRVFDINLRESFFTKETIERSLEAANVVKLNEQELAVLSTMFGLRGDVNGQIENLDHLFDLDVIALTRGEMGSLLYQAGSWSDLPGRKVDIVDTIGAGDAFTAALVMGLLNQLGLPEIHRIAADLAGFVCSQPGATPNLPQHLRAAFVPNCMSV
ncbi:MAG TPA: carbohydrate kinase [Verrucomicrobiae bacterium]|jgi:fructokinase